MPPIKNLSGKKVSETSSFLVKMGIHTQKLLGLNILSNKITEKCEEKKHDKDVAKFANQYNIKYKSVERCKNVTSKEQCWKLFDNQNEFFMRKRSNLPSSSWEYVKALERLKPHKHELSNLTQDQIETKYYKWLKYFRTNSKNIDKIRVNKQIEKQYEKKIFVSPCDNFTIYLEDEDIKKKIWIKGTEFTVSKLFGEKIKNLQEKRLVIFRLAPQHYHRYHAPITGHVISIKYLGEKYFSVNPIVVNSSKNVFTENIRVVIKLKNSKEDDIYLAIVGATCVGSIEITNPNILLGKMNGKKIENKDIFKKRPIIFDNPQPKIKIFDELGNFQFGGSTVIALLPKSYQLTEIGEKIKKNSQCENPIETEICVGHYLFTL